MVSTTKQQHTTWQTDKKGKQNLDKYIWTGSISFLFLRGVAIYGIRGEEVGR